MKRKNHDTFNESSVNGDDREHPFSNENGHNEEREVIIMQTLPRVKRHEVSEEQAFPTFVPCHIEGIKRPKRSWVPLSSSSKQILLQFSDRAKTLCISNIPESRRDDVLTVYDRIIESSTRKINERIYPKSTYSVESYDISYIKSNLNSQKKQNALLNNTLESLCSEINKEADWSKALEHEASTLQHSIMTSETTLSTYNKENPKEWSSPASTNDEQFVRTHRESSLSMWRRPKTHSQPNTEWWDSVSDLVQERYNHEASLRHVISQLTVIDEELTKQVNHMN